MQGVALTFVKKTNVMSTFTLHIPDMQSNHCRNRVRDVLSALPGIQTDTVEPGNVSISVDSPMALEEVILAIENAGYVVRTIKEEKPDEQLRFKTNINCAGCVSKVAPMLDEAEGVCHWEVDTASADKTLLVHSEGITADEVISRVRKAGFNIEPIGNAKI